MTPRICTSPMPGCALGHLSGCSARATARLLFEDVDVGRRQEAADDVPAAPDHAGDAALHGGHRIGNAAMDAGGERLRLADAQLLDQWIVDHEAEPVVWGDESDAIVGTGKCSLVLLERLADASLCGCRDLLDGNRNRPGHDTLPRGRKIWLP